MERKEYNGWTNYETWNVNLWLDNSEADQSYMQELAKAAISETAATDILTQEQAARYWLSAEIKLFVEQIHEDSDPPQHGVLADLLNNALSAVNWNEIAEYLLDAYKNNG